ncbi:MAG: hypothetical protein ACXW3Z_01395 [Limisphaerales bacterium]
MSARLTRFDFDEGDEFELPPRFERQELETRFNGLKEELLGELLEETETLDLHPRLKQAANEAAGIAWMTEFPLLVFPALFDELAKRERTRQNRQRQILAKTEHLIAEPV